LKKGFFAGLLDLKFETYITKRVASVLYAIFTWAILTATAGVIFAGITSLGSNVVTGIVIIFAGPIVGLLTLTVLRVAFESSIALVDIAINSKKE
jgi:hypothetical protein